MIPVEEMVAGVVNIMVVQSLLSEMSRRLERERGNRTENREKSRIITKKVFLVSFLLSAVQYVYESNSKPPNSKYSRNKKCK